MSSKISRTLSSDNIFVTDSGNFFSSADSLSLTDILKYIAEEVGISPAPADWSAVGENTQEFVFTCSNIPETGSTTILGCYGETWSAPDGLITITDSPASLFVPCGPDSHIYLLGAHFTVVPPSGNPDSLLTISGSPFDLPVTASETPVAITIDFNDLVPAEQ